jgi:hypothetical protein
MLRIELFQSDVAKDNAAGAEDTSELCGAKHTRPIHAQVVGVLEQAMDPQWPARFSTKDVAGGHVQFLE